MSIPDSRSAGDVAITLPDPWAEWPWQRRMNPFHKRAKAESCAWIASFKLFTPEDQARFDRCDFCVLGSLAYPDQNAEELRMTCDLLHLTFVFDDWTDDADEYTVRALAACILDALGDTPSTCRPDNILGTVTRDFWKRLAVVMPNPVYQRRLIRAFNLYLDAAVQEAQDRDRSHIRSIDDFFALRRFTAGTLPFWVFLLIGLDIPEDVLDHPRIQNIETLATDMVIICNDTLSYSVEHARGDMHSLVGVLTRRAGFPVQDAMEWADKRGQEFMEAAQKARAELPSFGKSADGDVRRYVEGLCNWVRACDAWSFESQRYLGERGREIQKHRMIILRKRP